MKLQPTHLQFQVERICTSFIILLFVIPLETGFIFMADQIRFTLKLNMLPTLCLNVVKFTLEEALSAPFCLEAELVSRNEQLDEDKILDQPATFTLWRDNEVVRYITGIVADFTRGDFHSQRQYKLTLVPELMRLSLRQNSRIFQDKNIEAIIGILLKEMGINDFAFNLTRNLPKREYCVQYRESDLAFVSRLAAEEGLTYAFEHQKDKSTLVFFDDNRSLKSLKTPLIYNNAPTPHPETPFVHSFLYTQRVKSSSINLKDYSFKNPANKLSFLAHSHALLPYEHYDFPGRFKDSLQGKAFTKQRLEYLRSEAAEGQGESNDMQLTTGVKVKLVQHPDNSLNIVWLITRVLHTGEQPQAIEGMPIAPKVQYTNRFFVMPSTQAWRPNPIQKPQLFGPQIARVTGPTQEEIFCDSQGRVKIHFPWDRYQPMSEKSSCWVRVSQGWAGAQYGMMALPRVGNEVIVSFFEADPDQPIITGRTFNALNMAPYSLPENKTKTVIRTNTYKGSGYNELSFDDENNNQKIYIHAEKNIQTMVKNDQSVHVGHDHFCTVKHDNNTTIYNNDHTHIKADKHLSIDGNQHIQITNNQHTIINAEKITEIKKDNSLNVTGAIQIKSGSFYTLDSAKDISIKSASKIILEAGSEISLKVGGNFISINASGVHLTGGQINLNSGGNASSANSFAGSAAIAPVLPQEAEEVKTVTAVKPKENQAEVMQETKVTRSPTPGVAINQNTAKNTSVPHKKDIKEDSAGEPFDPAELLYSESIQKTAEKYRLVIGLRAPNPLGQLHLKEGHPSKNFHIKAKSSGCGPTVGFITEKPLYSKIKQTPQNIVKHNDNIQDSLKKGGKLVPLTLTERQIEQAINAKLMMRLNSTTYCADYHDITMSFTIDEQGNVSDLDGPVMVLTNPPEKSPTPRKSMTPENTTLPVTADYDLFALLPRENASNNVMGFDSAPRFLGNGLERKSESFQEATKAITSPRKYSGQLHPDQGNTHYYAETINTDLNKNVQNEGYKGGILFWHGNETNNPYSPGLDIDADKPIFFIPNEPPRQIFTRKQLDLFYDEMRQKGYSVQNNPRF